MGRGDGRLSHEVLPGEAGPRDACGVFGVWTADSDEQSEASRLTFFGLYALQHRGQESAGIAASDGSRIVVYKDMGLVAQVFDEASLASLHGHLAIGHCRYSTTGASVWENAQPTFRGTPRGGIALAHNGNLTNTEELAAVLEAWRHRRDAVELDLGLPLVGTSDTDLVAGLLASAASLATPAGAPSSTPDGAPRTTPAATPVGAPAGLQEAAVAVLPLLRGAFSLVLMDETTLYAARDPDGIRPLVLGRLDRGWVVASETCALDIVGAAFVREVEPGELVAVDERGLRSTRFASATPHGCAFEYVYLARPDSSLAGRVVHEARVAMGRTLAREAPVDADLVIPVPESGTPAAIGYAQESGIPFGQGLVKNSYVGRTFIQPSQTIRQLGIRLKLNPLREVIRGRRLVVVDDSIVRGNTQRALVRMLREAGAADVHVRISSPPVMWPCFYGIDFATRAELIATGLGVEEIRTSIGADSLAYLSQQGLVAATGQREDALCLACFTGRYPVEVPPRAATTLTPARPPLVDLPAVGAPGRD